MGALTLLLILQTYLKSPQNSVFDPMNFQLPIDRSCPGNSFVGSDCNEAVTTSKSKKSSNLPVIIGATVGGVVLTLLIVIVGVYIGCRCRRRKANPQQNSDGSSGRAVPLKGIF